MTQEEYFQARIQIENEKASHLNLISGFLSQLCSEQQNITNNFSSLATETQNFMNAFLSVFRPEQDSNYLYPISEINQSLKDLKNNNKLTDLITPITDMKTQLITLNTALNNHNTTLTTIKDNSNIQIALEKIQILGCGV